MSVKAQRKKSVDLHFLQHRHKAGRASPLGVACAACFEQLVYVFASCSAMYHYTADLVNTRTRKPLK